MITRVLVSKEWAVLGTVCMWLGGIMFLIQSLEISIVVADSTLMLAGLVNIATGIIFARTLLKRTRFEILKRR